MKHETIKILDRSGTAIYSPEATVFASSALGCFIISLTAPLIRSHVESGLTSTFAAIGIVAACASYALASAARRMQALRASRTNTMRTAQALERDIDEARSLIAHQAVLLTDAEKRLEVMTTVDSVTHLDNHGSFQERFREELRRSRLGRTSLSLLRVNIDGFNRYNESYGHAAGDAVLTELAATLSAVLRDCDLAARYGGDDFVVLLPETDYLGALETAERLRVAVECAPWQDQSITVGIGAATLTRGARRRSDLMAQAEASLRYAKSCGENQAVHAGDLPSKHPGISRSKLTESMSLAA